MVTRTTSACIWVSFQAVVGAPSLTLRQKPCTTYDCKIPNRIDNSNILAFAALVRISRCGYAYTVSSTHGNRQFARRFRMCPG
jgi:hypothetical protein